MPNPQPLVRPPLALLAYLGRCFPRRLQTHILAAAPPSERLYVQLAGSLADPMPSRLEVGNYTDLLAQALKHAPLTKAPIPMRPGPELDLALADLLGWSRDFSRPDEPPVYHPPRWWQHLGDVAEPPQFSRTDTAAIQLLHLLEVAEIQHDLEYPADSTPGPLGWSMPSRFARFTMTIYDSEQTPYRVVNPSLSAAIALSLWNARHAVAKALRHRAENTSMIAIPQSAKIPVIRL